MTDDTSTFVANSCLGSSLQLNNNESVTSGMTDASWGGGGESVASSHASLSADIIRSRRGTDASSLPAGKFRGGAVCRLQGAGGGDVDDRGVGTSVGGGGGGSNRHRPFKTIAEDDTKEARGGRRRRRRCCLAGLAAACRRRRRRRRMAEADPARAETSTIVPPGEEDPTRAEASTAASSWGGYFDGLLLRRRLHRRTRAGALAGLSAGSSAASGAGVAAVTPRGHHRLRRAGAGALVAVAPRGRRCCRHRRRRHGTAGGRLGIVPRMVAAWQRTRGGGDGGTISGDERWNILLAGIFSTCRQGRCRRLNRKLPRPAHPGGRQN